MPPTAASNDLFARYVAFGNSITAGIQSGGINATTQNESYAVLLAESMGTTFNVPLLLDPGCPPPYANIFTQVRIADIPNNCAFRDPETPEYINNVAFPGADILEGLTNDTLPALSSTDAFKTLLLGGMTELEAAARVAPTFVTVWLGNNDALGAVLDVGNAGDPSLVTDTTVFRRRYERFMTALDDMGSIQGGVLIGVVQVAAAPYLTQGRVWKGFELGFDAQAQANFDNAFQSTVDGLITAMILPDIPTTRNATLTTLGISANFFDVAINCLDSLPLPGGTFARASVPFHMGGPMLSAAGALPLDSATQTNLVAFGVDSLVRILNPAASAPDLADLPTPIMMDCSVPDAVTALEVANLFSAVTQFNAAIKAEADAREDYIFLDPNDLLVQLSADTSAIRPFPAFPGTAAASATTDTPFGSAISLDGIHPSASTHVLVLTALIQAINAAFDVTLTP